MVSILMFIFAGAILIYALLLFWTKDVGLIMRSYAAKMKNKKLYAVRFAKVLAATAVAPALTGLAGFFTENVFFLMTVFIVSLILCITAGVKFFTKDINDKV